jgi:RNA polymerase sigma-54 factor
MRLDTSMSQRLEQKMILAPRMIQSMEILQLPVMALQERIEHELQENPVLEVRETGLSKQAEEDGETPPPAPEVEVDDAAKELVIDTKHDFEKDFDRLEAINRDWSDHFNEESRPSSNRVDEEMDKKHDAMANMASRPQSLQDYLNDQVGFFDIPEDEKPLVALLIANLDDRGYLASPLEDIAKQIEPPADLAKLESALKRLQTFDPPGVAARDYKECLLLQLTPETPYRDVVRALVLNHLEDIQHNRLPVIQKRTGYDLDTITEAIEVLKHLNPKPGAAYHEDNIPYVVPDIAVDKGENGDYEVKLLDDWTPNLYISKRMWELYKDKSTDPKAREFLKRKLQSAQWLMDAIEQRRKTLSNVTRAIIKHQKSFLDRGPEHIEPLKMQQIADQVGVHVTTVSRAVDDKWVQTPRGIFPLKRFFGGGTHTASGEEVAWETIKQKLLEVVGQEDKANPLSDEDLMKKLEEVGYPIARRTITKYRKMLNIPSSRQRKVWTE